VKPADIGHRRRRADFLDLAGQFAHRVVVGGTGGSQRVVLVVEMLPHLAVDVARPLRHVRPRRCG
jgi:hypothetical protein